MEPRQKKQKTVGTPERWKQLAASVHGELSEAQLQVLAEQLVPPSFRRDVKSSSALFEFCYNRYPTGFVSRMVTALQSISRNDLALQVQEEMACYHSHTLAPASPVTPGAVYVVLLFCAKDKEAAAVRDGLLRSDAFRQEDGTDWKSEVLFHGKRQYQYFRIRGNFYSTAVDLVQATMHSQGPVHCAFYLSMFVEKLKPNVLFSVGICGGTKACALDTDCPRPVTVAAEGTVCVGMKSWYLEKGRVLGDVQESDAERATVSEDVRGLTELWLNSNKTKAKKVDYLCGSKVVEHSSTELRHLQQFDLLKTVSACDMESYAILLLHSIYDEVVVLPIFKIVSDCGERPEYQQAGQVSNQEQRHSATQALMDSLIPIAIDYLYCFLSRWKL